MSRIVQNILIVDDEEDICFLLRSILKRQTDANIDIATSLLDAQGKLENVNYDLAFFDMHLGDGTGADLIEYLHSKKTKKPFIAVISAHTSPADMKKMNALRINEFIPKPLSRDKIINCFLAATA